MPIASSRPNVESDGRRPLRWAGLGVLVYVVSTSLVVAQFLRMLAKSEEPRNTREAPSKAESAERAEVNGPGVRFAHNEEAAFRAGVSTTFDVITVLRELVKEALMPPPEAGSNAKSTTGRGGSSKG